MNKIVVAAALSVAIVPVAAQAEADGRRIFRANCLHCHGGGASLDAKVKNLSAEEFEQIVLNGRGAMPAFKNNPAVASNVGAIYAHLTGGSEGGAAEESSGGAEAGVGAADAGSGSAGGAAEADSGSADGAPAP